MSSCDLFAHFVVYLPLTDVGTSDISKPTMDYHSPHGDCGEGGGEEVLHATETV